MTPRPTSVWPYFDQVQFWLRRPADGATLSKLRSECGRGGGRRAVDAHNYAAAFDTSYAQRIQMRQPSEAALKWIAGRSDALINRVETALDLIFDSVAERQDAFEYVSYHLIRRWHGKTQKIKLVGLNTGCKRVAKPVGKIYGANTRYDGSRRAPNSLVLYEETSSRLTGELASCHIEWRANGLRAVRNAGIRVGQDLVAFDHRGFWAKRLLLARPVPSRLGRLVRNSRMGTKRRTSDYWDDRTGAALVNSVGTVQELLDEYGHLGKVRRAIELMSNGDWLPRS